MHHESAVEIHEHTTGTAGAVAGIFALAHAFEYRFAPRIRDLGERKLYVTDRAMAEGLPDAAFGGVINRGAVEDNWDEVLRLAASIRAGTVPPSIILKKLVAFPRQNALHRALREMGRLERAIFTCDWLLDPELRRRSHGTLNKGESRYALARAVFFHRLGELRDRTAQDMAHRASGLNLAVNAIVLWNTTYLARAVAYVRAQGVDLTDEELSHVAPCGETTSRSPATTCGPTWTPLAHPSVRCAPAGSGQRRSGPHWRLNVHGCRNSHACSKPQNRRTLAW